MAATGIKKPKRTARLYCKAVILITGATGHVGGRVASLLASRGHEILRLSRQWTEANRNDIRAIIHCAADIRFGLPLGEARLANVGTTERLIDFARRCPRLDRFTHVSTVYAAGLNSGHFGEALFPSPPAFCNTYEQSKFEAEQVVANEARDLPIAIFRLSSIVSDSTGHIEQWNYVHQFVRLMPRARLVPGVPCDPEARIDLIPSDWAAPCIADLFENRFAPARIFNICAGPTHSLTVRELVSTAFEIAGLPLPRLIDRAEFDAWAANQRSGTIRELLRGMSQFLPHLSVRQSFEPNASLEAPPAIYGYYPAVVERCLASGSRTGA